MLPLLPTNVLVVSDSASGPAAISEQLASCLPSHCSPSPTRRAELLSDFAALRQASPLRRRGHSQSRLDTHRLTLNPLLLTVISIVFFYVCPMNPYENVSCSLIFEYVRDIYCKFSCFDLTIMSIIITSLFHATIIDFSLYRLLLSS